MDGPGSDSERLAALWDWLSTWIAPDGGVYGLVVYRFDLKRLATLHDTPWTQSAVIRGLLHLHRRSGDDSWLRRALLLADAQCERQEPNGRFAGAGHEDNRLSSLVHHALADCALLDAATVLGEHGDGARADRYLRTVEANVDYLVETLYRPALGGFAIDTYDYYAGRDRLVANMNSIAVPGARRAGPGTGHEPLRLHRSDGRRTARRAAGDRGRGGGELRVLPRRAEPASGSTSGWSPIDSVVIPSRATERAWTPRRR